AVAEVVAGARGPCRSEALVGGAAEQHRVGVAQDGGVELTRVLALELAGPQARVLHDVVERDECGGGDLSHITATNGARRFRHGCRVGALALAATAAGL